MHITRVVTKNYRCLHDSTTALNDKLNVLVGDNECGKSTLLEAIHLVLTGQLNGRPLQSELHPYLFTNAAVRTYVDNLTGGKPAPPPSILIELYFADSEPLSALKGTNNSRKENVPGAKLLIEFNEDYIKEYGVYTSDTSLIRTVPVEYYTPRLRSFADNDITPKSIPIKSSLIDASTIRNNAAASRYVIDIIKDTLTRKEQVDLALSYRLMKDRFLGESRVAAINDDLAKKKNRVSKKAVSVALDTSSRHSWEMAVVPHLDEIPISLVGKGEQNSVKVKLALESTAQTNLVLVEEAESHLSHSNLNSLIEYISENRGDRQIIITTHSSFVLNKLGIESTLLFSRSGSMTLDSLSPSTRDYFMKLPGHDTLRMILSRRAILVEGPSDELIVQAAYRKAHGHLPLADGVDVISVRSLAFLRFLEIASALQIRTDVVTDNDGDVKALEKKYLAYSGSQNVFIRYDKDESHKTLEPQLLKSNGRSVINSILETEFSSDEELLEYMKSNKTTVALKLFSTTLNWTPPKYIGDAVAE